MPLDSLRALCVLCVCGGESLVESLSTANCYSTARIGAGKARSITTSQIFFRSP